MADPNEKERAEVILEFMRNAYERDGNPLCVWQAWVACRMGKLPPPPWVIRYLDTTAENLITHAINPPEQVAPAVANALDMRAHRGRPNAFKEFHTLCTEMLGDRAKRDMELATAVAGLRRDGHKTEVAIEQTAKRYGVGKGTVRRATEKYVPVVIPSKLKALLEGDEQTLSALFKTLGIHSSKK